MADRELKWTILADSKQFEKAVDNTGAAAKGMAADLDKAAADAKQFGSAIDNAAERTDKSERTFMGTADVLDGLGTAFGLPLGQATELSRAAGDLTGGFTNLAPAIKGFGGSLQAVATGPMGIWLAVGAAIAGALVLLWKNSETFRDIVTGAFEAVKNVVEPVVDTVGGAIGWLGDKLGLGGGDADTFADHHKRAAETMVSAYEAARGDLASVFDAMIDPFEKFNHEQELTLAQATENLLFNRQEYRNWLDDIQAIYDEYGATVAAWVANQGPEFHGVADQLANATGRMGTDFAGLIDSMAHVESQADNTARALAGLGLFKQIGNMNLGGGLLSNVMPFGRRHSGGIVGGPMGRETPIIAQGGERVLPLGQSSGGGGIVVNVAGSVITERDLGRVVADALRNNRLVGVT